MKLYITIFFSFISSIVTSQEFNDSIMNQRLFEEIYNFTLQRVDSVDLHFTNVGSELYCDDVIEFIKENGFKHKHEYVEIIYGENKSLILNEFGITNHDDYCVGLIEILARVPMNGETTYRTLSRIALNAWLNSPGHRAVIGDIETNFGKTLIGISSFYNEKTQYVDIALISFMVDKRFKISDHR